MPNKNIFLLLKGGKDPLDSGCFRLPSLLDVDTKLLAKTLASRLEKVLPTIISLEQNGLI